MNPKNITYNNCSVARVLEYVGEWYSILILRDVMMGITRFDDLQLSLGISTNTLSKRLLVLVHSGILERRLYQNRPPRYEYITTEIGEEFLPILAMLVAFGNKHFSPNGIDTLIIDKNSHKPITPLIIDQVTGTPINFTTMLFAAGPDASSEKRKKYLHLNLPILENT
jgi:DNA-binding HxlR family transcriptional regulator